MADDLYGHPFRAIWQRVAGDLGITTARMHQSQMDMMGTQEEDLRDANEGLASAIQSADPNQAAVLAQMMRDRALQADTNIKLINNGQMPQQLPTTAQLLDPYYMQREQQEQTQREQAFQFTKGLRDEYHKGITETQNAIDKITTQRDTMLNLASSSGLGSDDKTVQQRFKQMLGSIASNTDAESLRGGGPIGELIATFLEGNDKKVYTADEIIKGTTAWANGQLAAPQAQLAALQKSAIAHGFQLDEGGGLLDLNEPSYRPQKPDMPTGPAGDILPVGLPPGTKRVPAGNPTAERAATRASIAKGATAGGILGHFLLHGAAEEAGASLGVNVGRLGGPLGMAAGAALGAIGGYGYDEAQTTLDQRLNAIAPGSFETPEGKIIDANGNAVAIPRGLAEQVRRRALARRQAVMRPTN